jgi:hypothetical protein
MSAVDMAAAHDAAVQLVTPSGQHTVQCPAPQRQLQQRLITDYVDSNTRTAGTRSAQDQQQAGQAGQPPATPISLTELKQLVVARFWELLADFTVLRAAPPQWLAVVSMSHPFLHPDEARSKFVVERHP